MHSNRERDTQLTTGACYEKKKKINPLGFAFENIDSIGRFRTMEKTYSFTNNALLANHPIDVSVNDVQIVSNRTQNFTDSSQMIDSFVTDNQGPGCFVRQLHRYYNASLEDTSLDACALDKALISLKGEKGDYNMASILESLKKVIVSDIMVKRKIK